MLSSFRFSSWLVLGTLVLLGCSSGRSNADDGSGGAGGAGGGSGAGGEAGRAGESSDPLRFFAVGDTGKGTDMQRQVGQAMAQKCAEVGCEFVILLGDNIYESGVDSVDDPQWQEKFEVPYADVDAPFYAVLGNHDYGNDGLGFEPARGRAQVDYSQQSDKWNMPDTFYTFVEKNVGFVMLDTDSLLHDDTTNGDQSAWYDAAVAELDAPWTIAAGHHPYFSNGLHGNAGSYAVPFDANEGQTVKAFMDDHVCGTVDVYVSGHDHQMEWLADQLCGAEVIVSGAGADPRSILPGTNADHFVAPEAGFLYLEVTATELIGRFIDVDGGVLFERTVTK